MKGSVRTATAIALSCAWAFTGIACSLIPSDPLPAIGPAHRVNAFIGVRFGDSIDEVERRFPAGATQTSPYGAPAYKVEDVNAGSIDYQDVVYEFTDNSGMQMAIAHFAPSACADVYQQLVSSFGAPSSSGATSDSPANLEASWKMSDGSSVLFSGPAHRLVLLGKDGSSLQVDIQLRDMDQPVSS